jgi:threonine dehydrogenase-like Zn-dependent dehydrogenase
LRQAAASFNQHSADAQDGTHVQKYLRPLKERIVAGKIYPSFLITHRVSLEEGLEAYKTFRDKKDGCVKVV